MLGHLTSDDFYAGSGIHGNFILIAFNTEHSHRTPPLNMNITEIELAVLRVDTGEGLLDNCQTAFTSNTGLVKALDLQVTENEGIYLLAEVSAGTVLYTKRSVSFTFDKKSTAIFMLVIDDQTIQTYPVPLLLDVKAFPIFTEYSPVALKLIYTSGIEGYGTPEILLLTHIQDIVYNGQRQFTGILIYGFNQITVSASGSVKQSFNPFVSDKLCKDNAAYVCLDSDKQENFQCKDDLAVNPSFLAKMHTCNPLKCPDGYYKIDKQCIPCHYSCTTCGGPLANQCLTCDGISRTYNSLTHTCNCPAYINKGACVALCETGSMGFTSTKQCKASCPAHTFHYVNYGDPSGVKKAHEVGLSGKNMLLEFSQTTSTCLILPGPTGITSIPDQFTVSFWISKTNSWTDDTRTLVWGFNVFEIQAQTVGGSPNLQFILKNIDGSSVKTPSIPSSSLALISGWNHVSVSMKRFQGKISTIIYVNPDSDTIGTPIRTIDVPEFKYPQYVNTLLLGCSGAYSSTTNSITYLTNSGFGAYMRDLVYQQRYNDLESLHANRKRAYTAGQQIYMQILSYWRFDYFQSSPDGDITRDSSQFGLSITIPPATSNPKASAATNPSLAPSTWDDVGECVDMFKVRGFPLYSTSPSTYVYNMLEHSINTYDQGVIQNIFTSWDTIKFYYNGCMQGTLIQTFKVSLEASGIVIERNKLLPISVQGRHVDVCYFSATSAYPIKLGSVYFLNSPTNIFPSHGSSDQQLTTPLSFTLFGGDQTRDDILKLESIESSVMDKMFDGILVDEQKDTYPQYSIKINSQGKFTKSVSGFDSAVYTLLWRPSYVDFQSVNDLIEYRNLFTIWSIQAPPKAHFKLLEDGSGMAQNGVGFKAEFFYLNLIGPGQADGDEVIFCNTGCHNSNRKGPVIQRKNAQYPPIWLGEEFGIANLLQGFQDGRLFICWRPAARAAVLKPSEDSWSTVLEDTEGGTNRAYIRVNNMNINRDLPEIIDIYPSMDNRVLRKGSSIWFRLSKCGLKKPKPSSGPNGVPGKIQVWHINYKDPSKEDFTKEIIWEQVFTSPALPAENAGFTVGKLYGDPSTCNFTLTELPFEKFIAGSYYRLVIFSNSIKSPISNEYFLGALDSNIPQFQYEFMYQETVFEDKYENIPPSQNYIEINGEGIGDVNADSMGIKRLFGAKIDLRVNPTCRNGYLPASFTGKSYFNGDTNSLKITGVDFNGCYGNLIAQIQLMKLYEFSDYPVWSMTTQNVSLGMLGCHETCLTCNGSLKENCTTCGIAPNIYLYKGMCLPKCGYDFPIKVPVYNSIGVFTGYYCVKDCPDGYYFDTITKSCGQCHSECRICDGDSALNCLGCKSMALTSDLVPEDIDGKLYVEKYLFEKTCTSICPVIYNYLSNSNDDMVKTDRYLKKCTIRSLPSGRSPIKLSIQPLAYKQRLNLQSSTRLRALVEDPYHMLSGITWASHPIEDFSIPGFETSDKRTFVSYAPDVLAKQVIKINMNSLNFKTNGDDKIIIARAKTNDSMAIGIMPLFGNLVLNSKTTGISVSNNNSLTTMNNFDIRLTGVEDPDDSTRTLNFRIQIRPISLSFEGVDIPQSLQDTLSLLATLPTKLLTIYASKPIPSRYGELTLSNIFIPPLINGPQKIDEGIILSRISCEILVIIEDKHQGVAIVKFPINITESYKPPQRESEIANLYEVSHNATITKNFTWDIALKITNIWSTIIVQPQKSQYLSYMSCSRDSHCNHGVCVTAAGRGTCKCELGYSGKNCQWSDVELLNAQNTASEIVQFLNETLLVQQDVRPGYRSDDINSLVQLSNVLIGLLTDAELVPDHCMQIIVALSQYLSKISINTALRLNEDEKDTVLKAFDSTISYIFYHLKTYIYQYYLLIDFQTMSPEYNVQYSEFRELMAKYVMDVRNSLYQFSNLISIAQFAGDSPFKKKYRSFEIFLHAELPETINNNLGPGMGIQLPSEKTFIKIPNNLLDSIAGEVSPGEEFMIRIINWFDNPYLFSTYHPEVITSVQNIAFLNCNGSELFVNVTDPIIVFLPVSNWTKNFPDDRVKCKVFNDTQQVNVTRSKITKETLTFSLGATSVSEKTEFYEDISTLPEFVDDDGVNSYGNLLKTDDYETYVPCALYKNGEVAAVVEKRRSIPRPDVKPGFYHIFDPMAFWRTSLGFYACMGMVALFGATYLLVQVMDQISIPKLEKTIEINRVDYSDNDIEMSNIEKGKDASFNDNSNADLNDNAEVKKKKKDKDEEDDKEEDLDDIEADDYEGDNHRRRRDESYSIAKRNIKESKSRNIIPLQNIKTKQQNQISEDDTPQNDKSMIETSPSKKTLGQSETKDNLTQEITTTMAGMKTGTNAGLPDTDESPDKIFKNTNVKGLRKKGTVAGPYNPDILAGTEDIFSEEHIQKREEYIYSFTNLYLQGNMFTNLFMRTSTTYLRTTRCIMLFLSIYLNMFWSAAFLVSTQSPLDRPDDFKHVTDMVAEQMWLPFAAPSFSFILLYLFAVLFKVSDSRVLETKTFNQYKRLLYFYWSFTSKKGKN